MIRTWRNELLFVAIIGLALLLLGLLTDSAQLLLGTGLIVYLAWHLSNFLLLQFWIARRRKSRLPISYGIWETVFDGLQREQSQRRRRGQQLVSSLSDYRDAAETLPDAIVILSEGAKIRWCNSAAHRLLGIRWPADRRRDINQFVVHPVLEDDLAKGHSSRPLEVPSPANGAWMLSIQITAPFGNQRERLLVARNITPQYRLEQTRRDFLANASHELRTPITVFRGYLEALKELAESQPQWEIPITHMDQQVQRMQHLVDDLLTLSRLEMAERAPAVEPVQVRETLSAIMGQARLLSGERNHDLQLQADPRLWLKGEERELHSAFSNLIFNAVRHTPPGTRVEVSWQGDQDGAVLSVRDYGRGIAAYHLPRLTERFYLVDAGRARRTEGNGLGLAIVKQVLDHYRAELGISSVVGEGTTFTCRFPSAVVMLEPTSALPRAG